MDLRRAGLTANPRKCHLALFEAKYLGFQVGRGLIKPQQKKVEAVHAAPRPTTKTQVRAFLGLAGYYRCFIPNFSSLAAPLTDLTRKGQPERVVWNPDAEEAFRRVKHALTEEPVLRAPDFGCPFLLQTDASETGLGAVLSQVQEGEEHPCLVYQQETDQGREKLRHRGEGGSGDKVGSPGAALLPVGPEIHPVNGPRAPPVDGQGERHQRQGDAVVPRAPGLLLCRPSPSRSLQRKRRRTFSVLVSQHRSVRGHSPPTPYFPLTVILCFHQDQDNA